MSSDRAASRLIALDWGTTSLRAYLLGDGGVVLDRRSEPLGILQVPRGEFARVFRSVTSAWTDRHAGLPAIASGMIGSAQGWIEAPYVDVPADAGAIVRTLVTEPESGLLIVPGLAQRGAAPDVMRGEETQLLGAMTVSPSVARGGRVVLPGTHSKWARVADGRIEGFTTYMTGELFAVLRGHSILGRLADPSSPAGTAVGPAFLRGVRVAGDAEGGLAAQLFSTRAAVLVGDLLARESLEYLSGLLIGDEVRSGLASGERPRALVGEPALCERYRAALGAFGVGEVEILGDTSPAGLWHIGRHALGELQRADGSSRRPVSGRDSLG
jgi:2-dehydro-3-deoxygalactonokinase